MLRNKMNSFSFRLYASGIRHGYLLESQLYIESESPLCDEVSTNISWSTRRNEFIFFIWMLSVRDEDSSRNGISISTLQVHYKMSLPSLTCEICNKIDSSSFRLNASGVRLGYLLETQLYIESESPLYDDVCAHNLCNTRRNEFVIISFEYFRWDPKIHRRMESRFRFAILLEIVVLLPNSWNNQWNGFVHDSLVWFRCMTWRSPRMATLYRILKSITWCSLRP